MLQGDKNWDAPGVNEISKIRKNFLENHEAHYCMLSPNNLVLYPIQSYRFSKIDHTKIFVIYF